MGPSLVLGLTAFAGSVSAHDVWLEPTSFRPRPGETVGIEVMVGEAFRGDAVPRRPGRIAAFWIGDGDNREQVRGVDGASPAGLVRLSPGAEGWRMVLYESRPASIELSADQFAHHLGHEGLEELVARLGPDGDSRGPVREVYSRCVVTLLAVGRATGELPDRPASCPIALWPVGTPRAPGLVEIELTQNGGPVEGALVRAHRKGREDGIVPIEGRTDAEGRVILSLAESGIWLLKAVRVEAPEGHRGEWRSWWASLTLELDGG